jgi:hypothetical protein
MGGGHRDEATLKGLSAADSRRMLSFAFPDFEFGSEAILDPVPPAGAAGRGSRRDWSRAATSASGNTTTVASCSCCRRGRRASRRGSGGGGTSRVRGHGGEPVRRRAR